MEWRDPLEMITDSTGQAAPLKRGCNDEGAKKSGGPMDFDPADSHDRALRFDDGEAVEVLVHAGGGKSCARKQFADR